MDGQAKGKFGGRCKKETETRLLRTDERKWWKERVESRRDQEIVALEKQVGVIDIGE